VHWYAGRSKNEVAGSLGLSRNTVRKYVAAAEAAGMAPGGPEVSQEGWGSWPGSGSRSLLIPGCGR
jgi:transposase